MEPELQKLTVAHREAQSQRRQLEQEQNDLPAALEGAISQGHVAEIQRLNRRKRELPEEYQVASGVEHAAYSALCRAQSNEQQANASAAHTAVERAGERLSLLRHENRLADEVACANLEKSRRLADAAENESSAIHMRFTEADKAFRAAVKEQQATA